MSDNVNVKFAAAADYLGTGALEIPDFESEITDIVRRSSTALRRFKQIPATGHPHRYFEQTAIMTGAFTDPRNIASSPTGPTRVERSVYIKAIVGQSNIGLFDKLVTQQQKRFASVIAKDLEDIISGIEILRANAVWNGNDTSLTSPTTQQYMGLLSQITNQATIASGSSIIDGLKAQVAAMVANTNYVIKPSAIYINPVLGDYIDREAKAMRLTLSDMEVAAGVIVSAINTQAGKLPLIPDPFLPTSAGAAYGFSAPASGNKNYYAVILSEGEVEIPYISGPSDSPNPMVFELGLQGNLTGQFVGVKFDHVVAKGATYMHTVVAVQRP